MELADLDRRSGFFLPRKEQSVKILRIISVFFLARRGKSQRACAAVGKLAELYLTARRKGRNADIAYCLLRIGGDGITEIGILTARFPNLSGACGQVLIQNIMSLSGDLTFGERFCLGYTYNDIVIVFPDLADVLLICAVLCCSNHLSRRERRKSDTQQQSDQRHADFLHIFSS